MKLAVEKLNWPESYINGRGEEGSRKKETTQKLMSSTPILSSTASSERGGEGGTGEASERALVGGSSLAGFPMRTDQTRGLHGGRGEGARKHRQQNQLRKDRGGPTQSPHTRRTTFTRGGAGNMESWLSPGKQVLLPSHLAVRTSPHSHHQLDWNQEGQWRAWKAPRHRG